MTTVAVSQGRVADLLLVRLLVPTRKPVPPSRLREDLGSLLPQPLGAGDWQKLVEDLASAGLLEAKPLRLTPAGEKQGLAVLGVEALPAKADWRTIKDRYLVPLALGVPPGASQAREKLMKAEGLGAWLLKARHGLPSGTGNTLNAALEAVACRQLGFPGETSLEAVRDEVLSRLLGAPRRLAKKDLARQLVQAAAGARGADLKGLRSAALRRWLREEGPAVATDRLTGVQEETEPFDLPAFAATARAAARACPTGRFGDNKVFISHAWRQLESEPRFPVRSLDEFKRRLVEANQAGLLRLSRADLVQAMNADDVRLSEAEYIGSVFHFILLEEDRP